MSVTQCGRPSPFRAAAASPVDLPHRRGTSIVRAVDAFRPLAGRGGGR